MLNTKSLLVLLYKLVSTHVFNKGNKYEYNYDYLNPLAITDVSEIPLINLPRLPKDERPSIEWILLVLKSITVVNLNGIFKANSNNDIKGDRTFLTDQLDFLENVGQRINNLQKPEDLGDIAFQLVSTLRKIHEHLSIDEKISNLRQLKSTQELDNNISFSLEENLKTIDFHIAGSSNESPEDISELDSSEKDSLNNLKEIIQYNAKLLDLAEINSFNAPQAEVNERTNSAVSLEDYDHLFRVIKKPEIATKFQDDLVFAYMQVAGTNPVMLQQITTADPRLPITNEQYQEITSNLGGYTDSLEIALKECRLYLADYSLLNSMENGDFPRDQKYLDAPVALFAVPPVKSPSRSLIPVAINIKEALFTPLEEGSWMTAKNILQMADSNYHELVTHLGQTHLFIEAFVVATNHLPTDHNLRKLLKPHLQGTVLINYGAHKFLVAPKGSVDKLLAGNIKSDQEMSIKGAQKCLFNFNEVAFPKTLQRRGVNDSTQLPIYPYRDDGMLIWNAIHSWVHSYLSVYYTDSSIRADEDLQAWGKELNSETGGRLQNFGEDGQGGIQTLNYLVEAVSTIIFTASAQHAAVNFAQLGLMIYPPAFPLARYTYAPTNPQDSDNFINGLPPLDRAIEQIDLLYLLGSIYYTKLGEYTSLHFNSPRIKESLRKFQNQLQDIEKEIRKRNENGDRLLAYEYLLPSKIPQSINI